MALDREQYLLRLNDRITQPHHVSLARTSGACTITCRLSSDYFIQSWLSHAVFSLQQVCVADHLRGHRPSCNDSHQLSTIRRRRGAYTCAHVHDAVMHKHRAGTRRVLVHSNRIFFPVCTWLHACTCRSTPHVHEYASDHTTLILVGHVVCAHERCQSCSVRSFSIRPGSSYILADGKNRSIAYY